jgi:hypothetical protein
MRVRVFHRFMDMEMRMETAGWNLPSDMPVCVVSILVEVTMVVLDSIMNVFMNMFLPQQQHGPDYHNGQ